MTIKKASHPRTFPAVHPGLDQKIREAEDAERKGETPKDYGGAQKITRPAPLVGSAERAAQVRALGLIDPAYKKSVDGLAALAAQQPFRPGEDLDVIWDELSEAEKIQAGATERFRLEMKAALTLAMGDYKIRHQIAGSLNKRNLERSLDNLQTQVDALTYLLAPDVEKLLRRFLSTTTELVMRGLQTRTLRGVDGPTLYGFLEDLLHKMVYQELTSRRRAMGDRGIRRICSNIDVADMAYESLQQTMPANPRMRLVTRLIHIHQDLGHTAYAARASFRGARMHRAYGARIFNDDVERYRQLMPHQEIELMRTAIATHSSEEFPFGSAVVLALARAVDHLAPFGPHNVYWALRGLKGVTDFLDDLLERAQDEHPDRYIAVKEHFVGFIEEQELSDPLKEDILAAMRPYEKNAFYIDLDEVAGTIKGTNIVAAQGGLLVAHIEPDPFIQKYQALFDYQQEQLSRMAERLFVEIDDYAQHGELRFQRQGHGGLIIQRASSGSVEK